MKNPKKLCTQIIMHDGSGIFDLGCLLTASERTLKSFLSQIKPQFQSIEPAGEGLVVVTLDRYDAKIAHGRPSIATCYVCNDENGHFKKRFHGKL